MLHLIFSSYPSYYFLFMYLMLFASEYFHFKIYKIDVLVAKGKHEKQEEIDKQVNDKERVLAALENEQIADVIQDLTRERNWI